MRMIVDLITAEKHGASFTSLLDHAFAVPAGSHFLDDFPVWNEQLVPNSHEMIRLGVFNKEDLVACCGVRIAQLVTTGPNSLCVAIIGAVATREDQRGKGLATQVVSLGLQWAQERGAALVLLWGSEHRLYEKLGFDLCGIQHRIPLSQLVLNPQVQAIEDVKQGWTSSLYYVIRQRASGLALRLQDRVWYEAHKNVQWYWSGSEEHPTAYAAVGRGIDLKDVVHEWGGERKALEGILSKVKVNHPSAVLLGSPSLFDQQGWKLLDLSGVECLGLVNVLNPQKAFKSYCPETNLDEKYFSSVKGISMGRLLFGPVEQDLGQFGKLEIPSIVGHSTWSTGSSRFPFPLWVWGLDAA